MSVISLNAAHKIGFIFWLNHPPNVNSTEDLLHFTGMYVRQQFHQSQSKLCWCYDAFKSQSMLCWCYDAFKSHSMLCWCYDAFKNQLCYVGAMMLSKANLCYVGAMML